jgi:hypothetical protein
MSMRSIIVGAFATSVILFTEPLALASHRPQFFPVPGRFGPFGIHHRATPQGCTPWQSATKTRVCSGGTKGRQFICHPGQWCHPYFGCTS